MLQTGPYEPVSIAGLFGRFVEADAAVERPVHLESAYAIHLEVVVEQDLLQFELNLKNVRPLLRIEAHHVQDRLGQKAEVALNLLYFTLEQTLELGGLRVVGRDKVFDDF